jgi:hypothetical protein
VLPILLYNVIGPVAVAAQAVELSIQPSPSLSIKMVYVLNPNVVVVVVVGAAVVDVVVVGDAVVVVVVVVGAMVVVVVLVVVGD